MNARSTLSLQKVAHRGGSALAPENTMAAFRNARTLPVDAIEFDVQMSRDGHAVVFHDETLERLTDGQGNMLDLDLAYLRELNVAAHFSGGWPEPQRMPLLSEVLDFVRPAPMDVYLEIKASRRNGVYGRYPGIVEAVIHEVQARSMLDRVLFMAFDWGLLSQVRAQAPGAVTAALVSYDIWQPSSSSALSELAARVIDLGCQWVNMDVRLFTPEMPAFFHSRGLSLGVWTVNEAADLLRLAAAGVDSLTTDRPDFFL